MNKYGGDPKMLLHLSSGVFRFTRPFTNIEIAEAV